MKTNTLVTFFSENPEGKRLVGIGITDEVIEYLKKHGGIIEDSELTGQDTDVVVMYAPDLNELMKIMNTAIPKDQMKVKMI